MLKPITSIALIALASAPVLLGFAPAAFAEQYNYCYPVEKTRTIRDSASHPNAYDDGYREGAEAAREGDGYEPRSVGGEFARGFDDGYYGRPYTGQQNTIPDRTETYTTSECRTYYYDTNDPINEILKDVLDQFQRDMRLQLRDVR